MSDSERPPKRVRENVDSANERAGDAPPQVGGDSTRAEVEAAPAVGAPVEPGRRQASVGASSGKATEDDSPGSDGGDETVERGEETASPQPMETDGAGGTPGLVEKEGDGRQPARVEKQGSFKTVRSSDRWDVDR